MATTYDKASLVMIPSGVKESKLYSIKPTDGDGDFTFNRGTDTATRVNSSGLIEKERGNLLTYSNTFSSWTPANAVVTDGQSGYDGTSDAWQLDKAASAGNIQMNVSSSGVHTFSYYAKAGSVDWTRLLILGTTNASTYINLTNGAIGVGGGGFIDATATDVSGGWYRVSITHSTAITQVRIYPADDDDDTSGSSGNIYIQDAQLEQGLVATDYIETTTAAVYEGITDNLPRLDYSGGASCPSLLLEPSRSNLIPYSEYFGASDWVKLGAGTGSAPIITHNYATSPEGVQNATRIQLDLNGGTSSGDQSLFYDDLGTKTGDFTRSVYIKSLTSDTDLYFGGTLTDKKIITATTEWQRFEFKSTLSSASLYATIGLRGTTGSSDSADILIYGFQAEAGSYPTSYIPTYGTSASRAFDDCEKTSASALIGQTEGTMFAQLSDFPKEFSGRIFAITQNSSNYITILKNGTNDDFRVLVSIGGSGAADYQGTSTLPSNTKIAVGYANNDYVVYVNGTQVHTDTSASVPTCSNIFVGKRENGTATYSTGGGVKQALLFKTRLTNAELAALTTI